MADWRINLVRRTVTFTGAAPLELPIQADTLFGRIHKVGWKRLAGTGVLSKINITLEPVPNSDKTNPAYVPPQHIRLIPEITGSLEGSQFYEHGHSFKTLPADERYIYLIGTFSTAPGNGDQWEIIVTWESPV